MWGGGGEGGSKGNHLRLMKKSHSGVTLKPTCEMYKH